MKRRHFFQTLASGIIAARVVRPAPEPEPLPVPTPTRFIASGYYRMPIEVTTHGDTHEKYISGVLRNERW